MAEGSVQPTFIGILDEGQQAPALFLPGGLADSFADDEELKVRDDHHGYKQGDAQSNGDCPGKHLHKVIELSCQGEQEGKEGNADGQSGRENSLEEFPGTADGGVPARNSLPDFFQIAVNDDDGVVHNHPEDDNQGRQGDRVELHPAQIHDGQRDKDAHGNGGGRNGGHPEGKQQHGHQDDRQNGQEELLEEGGYGVPDHFRLVGNTQDMDVLREFLLEGFQHLVHLSSVLYNIVSGLHLHGNQQAFPSVILDVAFRLRVFAYDPGDIPEPDEVSLRVGIHNLFPDFFFGLVGGRDVDGVFGALIVNVSAHRGESLQEQIAQEGAGGDSVGRELFGIQVDADLLGLQPVVPDFGHRFHPAQPVFQLLKVCFQLPVGTLVAFQGDEQGGGLPEIVVRHERQYARGQAALEGIEPVVQFGPEFISTLHPVVEFHKHNHHAVSRHRVGLASFDLLEPKEVFLHLLGELVFHLPGTGPGVHPNHQALPDGEFRKFLPGHVHQGVHPQQHENSGYQQHNLPVPHGPFNETCLVVHLTALLRPKSRC